MKNPLKAFVNDCKEHLDSRKLRLVNCRVRALQAAMLAFITSQQDQHGMPVTTTNQQHPCQIQIQVCSILMDPEDRPIQIHLMLLRHLIIISLSHHHHIKIRHHPSCLPQLSPQGLQWHHPMFQVLHTAMALRNLQIEPPSFQRN